MNGLKKAKDLKKAEFLDALKTELGDKYSKTDEARYMELRDMYSDKAVGVAIRQIAEMFKYHWETSAIFINAKEAPAGRRGGEGIQAFFISTDGTPILGFMYGTATSPFELSHRYTLSGREIPNRGSVRIVNYNDEGEVPSDDVIKLLKQASERIDAMVLPEDISRGGVPKVVTAKFIPFVQAEPEWPTAEEREPGEQVRPKGDQPFVQYVGGKLQPSFNATMSDGGKGRVRCHIRPVKTGSNAVELFISQTDLESLQTQIEQGADVSASMAQLIGNQGAICVGSLYRVERSTMPDRTEIVYRDMDLVYAIPDEEAAKIVIPQPQRAPRGGEITPTPAHRDIEGDIITMVRSFDGKMSEGDINLMPHEQSLKEAALAKLVKDGKLVKKEIEGTTFYTLPE